MVEARVEDSITYCITSVAGWGRLIIFPRYLCRRACLLFVIFVLSCYGRPHHPPAHIHPQVPFRNVAGLEFGVFERFG